MSNKFVPVLAAYRLYEDGTESGSTPIEDQDVATTGRDVATDSQVQIRVRIDETGDGDIAGETTDDWTLEYRLNGGGSWIIVTGASARVKADTGSTLTDDGDTTNRGTNGISDGTGSFFAGIQEAGDAEITDFQHEANNFTEHVWGLLLVSADLIDADNLIFRVALNGSNISSSQTPEITVSKAATDVLLADDVESASEVTAPAVGQEHTLLATSIESASEVTAPVILLVTPLLAEDIESASEVSAPAVGQEHALLAVDVESASEVGSPALDQEHALLADDVESTSEVSAPMLVESGGAIINNFLTLLGVG